MAETCPANKAEKLGWIQMGEKPGQIHLQGYISISCKYPLDRSESSTNNSLHSVKGAMSNIKVNVKQVTSI